MLKAPVWKNHTTLAGPILATTSTSTCCKNMSTQQRYIIQSTAAKGYAKAWYCTPVHYIHKKSLNTPLPATPANKVLLVHCPFHTAELAGLRAHTHACPVQTHALASLRVYDVNHHTLLRPCHHCTHVSRMVCVGRLQQYKLLGQQAAR